MTRSCTAPVRVFRDAWFAISRAVEQPTSSTIRSRFSRSVRPVCVRSTIASTRPTSGASSTDPWSSTISARWPSTAMYWAVACPYFVPTRSDGGHVDGPSRPDASGTATISRHSPKPRSSSS